MSNHFLSYLQETFEKLKLANLRTSRRDPLLWTCSVRALVPFFHHFFLQSFFSLDALNNLQNRLFNLKVVQLPKRKQFTLKDVSAHCSESDCWMVVKDLVYDLTEFMHEVSVNASVEHRNEILLYSASGGFRHHVGICRNGCNDGIC